MKGHKKNIQTAKALCKCCYTNDKIDPVKIKTVLKHFEKTKSTNDSDILRTFKRLIETAISKENVIVEAAQEIPKQQEFEKMLLEKTGANKVLYRINPNLVFGLRIIHGDKIYDATLDAKLNQLMQQAVY